MQTLKKMRSLVEVIKKFEAARDKYSDNVELRDRIERKLVGVEDWLMDLGWDLAVENNDTWPLADNDEITVRLSALEH